MKYFDIDYYGDVVAKPRMTRRDTWANRPVVSRYWSCKDALLLQAKQDGYDPETMRIRELHIVAYIRQPKTWSKIKQAGHAGQFHLAKPDADNIIKAVCDALTSDDSGIYTVSLTKLWGAATGSDNEYPDRAEGLDIRVYYDLAA